MVFGRAAKEIVAACVVRSGIASALRVMCWRDRVLILVYHNPTPQVLHLHLSHLCGIADPVELTSVTSPGTGRPRFVITLDDGHAGNRGLVDVCRAHGVRPTIFVCSQIIGTKRQFWWQASKEVTARAETLKRLSNAERKKAMFKLGFSQEAEIACAAALSSADIAEMKLACDFQSHGRFHPILTRCDDLECEIEISRSRREIKAITGGDCSSFAYPNGNYGDREVELVRSAGYALARTLDLGWNDSTTDPFRLKAVAISDDATPAWFVMQISMIAPYLRYLRQGSWFGRFRQF